MKILITRPLQEATKLAQELTSLGHQAVVTPLLEIEHLNNIYNLQNSVLITSKNALHSITHLDKNIELFILGKKTTKFANSLGFKKASCLGVNISELKQNLTTEKKLIYLSGDHVTDDFKDYRNITRKIVYRAKEVKKAPEGFIEFFKSDEEIKVCTIFSIRTADIFLNLVNMYQLNFHCGNIILITLSDTISNRLNTLNFKTVLNSDTPELESIVSLINKLYDKK